MNATPFDIAKVNQKLRENKAAAVLESEKALEAEVCFAAEKIFSAGERVKIVLVSGRSASGKTTFTKKVCRKLCEMGRNALHISLDDFFLGIDYLPKNADGTYDMESIKGLDTALANACFKELLEKGESSFPTFDFPKQNRGKVWNEVKLGKNGLIMIEGIHALNPILTENLPEEDILRMYIEPQKSYLLGGEEVFSSKEIRLLRRMTRDELFRSWSAEKTLIQWKSVLEGEKIYIEPYIHLANIKVNTAVDFEPGIYKEILAKMLGKIGENSLFFEEAKTLLAKLELFEEIPDEILPKYSLLREFVG